MNRAVTRRPRDSDGASTPSWVRNIFSPLFCGVSDRCINLIAATYIKVISHEFTVKCEDPWVRTCQDCHVCMRLLTRTPITVDNVHDFWKQLDWEDPSSTQIHSSSSVDGLTGKKLRDMWSKFESRTLKQITAEQLTDLYIDLEYSEESTFAEPSVVEKVRRKGRPPGGYRVRRARDKSLFEHRETWRYTSGGYRVRRVAIITTSAISTVTGTEA